VGAFWEDFFKATGKINREFSKLIIIYKSIFVFSDASWNAITNEAGLGFLITANLGMVLLAGFMGANHPFPINAEIDDICQTLQICKDNSWNPDKICCDCPGVAQLIQNLHPYIARRSNDLIKKLKHLMKAFPDISMTTISREENCIIDDLAAHGSLNPQLSLFFRGMD